MGIEERGDRFQELEEAYKDYTVYDQHYERIGRVDDLFVDENDRPEYIGVKTGFLGMKSTLIPMELARVNDRRRLIEVAADKHTVTEGPAFDDDEEITPDHEARIYGYYGLEHPGFQEGRGGYGDYYASDPAQSRTGEDLAGSVDTEYGERREEALDQPAPATTSSEPVRDRPDTGTTSEPGVADEPEEREQTAAGEQGTGSVRVFKRVRTDQ
ncbi:MAG: PRC-barrel domain-containing protein [Actinomycetota bacterium]|nr:PRC-barrel domain-containing protein [Actinomycetota bacterium]